MSETALSFQAIETALNNKEVYCKFLSANDSGETGGHQSGILISKSAKAMFFSEEQMKNNHILKNDHVKVLWQNNIKTESAVTWYASKNELRLTRFGHRFDLLRPEYTGALFVLVKISDDNFSAWLLNTDEDIQQFLDAFGLTPAETNRPISFDKVNQEVREKAAIDKFIRGLSSEFPSSEEMSQEARILTFEKNKLEKRLVISNPDKILLDWTEEEYRLFRAIENYRYGDLIQHGFGSVDEFVSLANRVLNRRKSRAGKSLEHHLSAIFDENHIRYTAQAVTEGNKKPDFLFPSEADYHNMTFSIEKLCSLAAKTTCKDRWRQILNEGDRFRGRYKFLCTMQQGISSAQMDEMQAEMVILVVPRPYISAYPKDKQDRIWTIKKFLDHVSEMEGLND